MQNITNLKKDIKKCVKKSNQVFITCHLGSDLDAISSAIGMSLIIKKLNKPVYILFDEGEELIEPGVKKIIDEMQDKVSFIKMDTYERIKSDKDLLICLDTNKKYLVCCEDGLNNFNDILIIDHHNTDEDTINTKHSHINTDAFSTSEIITELLSIFKIKIDSEIANYLLAGIYLDTNKLSIDKIPKTTWKAVQKLILLGANTTKVNELFVRDFESDKKVRNLINQAKVIKLKDSEINIAISVDKSLTIYTKEELAKVANALLEYKFAATFAIGYIKPDLISISARSLGYIDISQIMSCFGGGGTKRSSAARVNTDKIEEICKKLEKIYK